MSSSSAFVSRKRAHSGYSDDSDSDVEPPRQVARNNEGYGLVRCIKRAVNWVKSIALKNYFVLHAMAGVTNPGSVQNNERRRPPPVYAIDDDDDDDIQIVSNSQDSRNFSPMPKRRDNFVTLPNKSRKLNGVNKHLKSSAPINSNPFGIPSESLRSSNMKNHSKSPSASQKNYLKSSSYECRGSSSYESRGQSEYPSKYKHYPTNSIMNGHDYAENASSVYVHPRSYASEKSPSFSDSKVNRSDSINVVYVSKNKGRSATPIPSSSKQSWCRSRRSLLALPRTSETPKLNGHLNHINRNTAVSSMFTTQDVIKMHEREKYMSLLQQYTAQSKCKALSHPSRYKNAETQVNLTASKSACFSKETLQQPIENYMERYLKPCQLVKPLSSALASAATRNEGVDDEKEMVLDIKLPKPRTFSPSVRSSAFFSHEWIYDLKKAMIEETNERMKLVEDHQRQLREYRESRDAKYAEEMKLEQQWSKTAVLKEGSNLEEDLSADFPEITGEMEAVINNALIPDPPSEMLSSLSQYQVLRKDMDTLSGLNWLNDEIINFYLALIVERGKLDNYPTVYAVSSFFYPKLKQQGHAGVKRWTRKVDIFSFDLILIPLHLGVHWCLAVIDFRHKSIQYYDSMGGSDDNCLETLKNYLAEESLDKKGKEFDLSGWHTEVVKGIPPQLNGSDCGMFTLKYAEYITRNAKITFSQQNMQYFRRRMVYEIMTRKLL